MPATPHRTRADTLAERFGDDAREILQVLSGRTEGPLVGAGGYVGATALEAVIGARVPSERLADVDGRPGLVSWVVHRFVQPVAQAKRDWTVACTEPNTPPDLSEPAEKSLQGITAARENGDVSTGGEYAKSGRASRTRSHKRRLGKPSVSGWQSALRSVASGCW